MELRSAPTSATAKLALARACIPTLAVAALLSILFLVSAPALAAEKCFECHSDASNVGDPKLEVHEAAWQRTVHGEAGLSCTDCHAGKGDYPHKADQPLAACSNCHSDAEQALAASVHGAAGRAGTKGPNCASCHGSIHELVAKDDTGSPVNPRRLAATCGTCHSDPKLAQISDLKLVQPLAAYAASVHARGIEKGEHAATCNDCHGAHDVLPASDPNSKVHRPNVPATCGACHKEIAATYAMSVHGQAAARGVRDAPVCTDCHGEHRILGPAETGSPVYASNVPKLTCGRCHGDLRLSEKFGLKSTALESFEDSFHGLASRSGNKTVANCASCHGVHDILPSSDARSHIAPANLAKTCGGCHAGIEATARIGPVHVLPSARGAVHPAVYWIRAIYIWMIFAAIGGMLLHNGLDFYRKARLPEVHFPAPPGESPLRMGLGLRIAHGLLAVSFIVLAYTGFALKFPEAWWSRPLAQLGGGTDLRGLIHRIAAVVMLGSAAVHVVDLLTNRRTRACAKRLVLPNLGDWHELKEKVAFLAGRKKEVPEGPWVGYAEKIEYLAVIWGTLVMSATGFVLWFENYALRFAPKWITDVATVIHFWEAALATLAILVWHFYMVIFDPVVYPVDPSFWTGRSAPGRAHERRNSVPAE